MSSARGDHAEEDGQSEEVDAFRGEESGGAASEPVAVEHRLQPFAPTPGRPRSASATGIESFNAGIERTQYGALDSPGKRQVRGRTAAFVFTTMVVVAEAFRLIDNFVADQAQAPEPKPPTKRRRDLAGSWGEESPLHQQAAGPAPPAAARCGPSPDPSGCLLPAPSSPPPVETED